MPASLDAQTTNLIADTLYSAVEEGFGEKLINLDYDTPDFNLEASLKSDVWQFSGAKNYQEMKAMTEALTGPDGKIVSYSEFKKAVGQIIDDHVGWLQTEYRTAVASSQMAAKWVGITKDKKTLPLLQFDAVMDNHTTELCKGLNGVIKPIDDPFWDVYYPPNHFNCRSDVRQLASGTITPEDKIDYPDIPDMFRTNVAKQGLVFPAKSAYYKGLPDNVRTQAERLLYNNLIKWAKKEWIGKTVVMKEIENVGFKSKGIEKFINQNHDEYQAKNMAIYKIDEIMSTATFINSAHDDDPQKPLFYYYFQTEIKGKPSYLVIKENLQTNERYLWSMVTKIKNAP